MKPIYWIIALMCCTTPCFCQEKWEEYLLQLAENTDGEQDLNNLYDELVFLSQHPVDLNNATREELERLPFLSSVQIGNILTYIAQNGKMQRIYELRLVPELSMDDIELLLPFVYAGVEKKPPLPMSPKDMATYGDHNLLVRWDKSLNDKEGFAPVDAEELAKNPNKRYLGESFYHSVRYDFQYNNRIRAGFTAEKDSGEPFFTKLHRGYDAYSGYFVLHNVWKIRTLAAGDYRVSIGQGLILNSEFSMGKSSQTSTVHKKRNADIKPHSSMDEFNYFRGAGGKFSFGKFHVMLFYSNKPLDATVDSLTNSMTSIKKDGLHRTENDWKKKNVACLQTLGGSVGWSGEKFSGGLNLIHCNFDKPLHPDDKPYNRFYFRGTELLNVSFDYQYTLSTASLFGEIALSGNKAFAAVAGVVANPASYCRISLLYRYYDKSYQTFFGNAFSESSGVQNEKGVYMGIEFQPVSKLRVNAYADFFRFPWLRYGVDAPSGGFDGLLQLTYTPTRHANMSLRYRYKNKDANAASAYLADTLHTHPLGETVSHRLRYQANFQLHSTLKSKTTVDYTALSPAGTTQASWGISAGQEIVWSPKKFPLTVSLQSAWFRTDDYNSRIYTYERNVLYAFSVPSFYGKGIRTVANVNYTLKNRLTVWLRFANTSYLDNREEIGSGLEKITGKTKSDLSLQIRWKF